MRLRGMGDLVKVIVFVTVTSALTALVGMTFAQVRLDESHTYTATFTDVSGLDVGVPVRASGVDVGRVKSMALRGVEVDVQFTVDADIRLTEATQVTIRYANLTGDRYIDLTQDPTSDAAVLADGDTIGVDRTAPALDLDELFTGFQPLMQALSPDDVNELSSNIIAVTQGQGEAVVSLLSHVGSLTTDLAERDALIGSVITNLNTVLSTVDDRSVELDQLIVGLDDLVGGLAHDRDVIGASLDRINILAGDTTSLLTDLRPGLESTLSELTRFGSLMNADADFVVDVFRRYHDAVISLGRGGAYGSFFNFYLCGIRLKFSDAASPVPIYTPWLDSDEARCTV